MVTQQGSNNIITGGTTASNNLFHSFAEFSLPTGNTVLFDNPISINNIFTRVTGNSISNIDGLIQANGTANLYLINPNGIIFGSNASLKIGGSFVATTANAIQFDNKGIFSASIPNDPSLLKVNPSAFLFNQLKANAIASQATLKVPSGQNLFLLGGNVQIEGGQLLAPGGHVELGGVADNGIIPLQINGSDFSLSFPVKVQRADVALTNGATVNVRAAQNGSIVVNARNLDILAGSTLRAGMSSGLGTIDGKAGNVEINTISATTISDGSFISNAVLSQAQGHGGDINITSKDLFLTNGGQIYAGLRDGATGGIGNININAKGRISIDGQASNGASSGIYNLVEFGGVGQGGNINITAQDISVTKRGIVQSSTLGHGNAGSVNINAYNQVFLEGTNFDFFVTGIYNRVENQDAVGNTGGINITANQLIVTNGAVITGSTDGKGNAGNININARDRIILDGVAPLFNQNFKIQQSSGIFSSVKENGIGQAGDITLNTSALFLNNGALVIASNRGQGQGGNIRINAFAINLKGVGEGGQSSGIFVPTELGASGAAGNILIDADVVQVTDAAVISSRTHNSSNGGNITVNAKVFEAGSGGQVLSSTSSSGRAGNIILNANTIKVSGSDPTYINRLVQISGEPASNVGADSGVFVNTTENSTGNGGSATINTASLQVFDRGKIAASADGTGAAGNLKITANFLSLDNGIITANTTAGDRGNITIQSKNTQLRHNGNITTNASNTANGGNITLNTDTLVALENSDIRANAIAGQGGNIAIASTANFRSFDSDIDASSQLGINGVVSIKTLDNDPLNGLTKFPIEIRNSQISQGCIASTSNNNNSSFVALGGLPSNPAEVLSSHQILDDLGTFQEAQGMVTNSDGQIQLVAILPCQSR